MVFLSKLSPFLVVGLVVFIAATLWLRFKYTRWIAEGEDYIINVHPPSELVDRSSLPLLLRDYLDKVLSSDAMFDYVNIKQEGVMVLRPGAAEIPFKASQTSSINGPHFSWTARFPLLPILSIKVCDRLVGERGDLQVRAYGAFPISSVSNSDITRSELLRYLAELPWMPQAILRQKTLNWRAIDRRTLEVSTSLPVEGRVFFEFDEEGLIVRSYSPDRPRDLEGKSIPTPWEGRFSQYRWINEVFVPSYGEVSWLLDSGPYTYWKGSMLDLEFVKN